MDKPAGKLTSQAVCQAGGRPQVNGLRICLGAAQVRPEEIPAIEGAHHPHSHDRALDVDSPTLHKSAPGGRQAAQARLFQAHDRAKNLRQRAGQAAGTLP